MKLLPTIFLLTATLSATAQITHTAEETEEEIDSLHTTTINHLDSSYTATDSTTTSATEADAHTWFGQHWGLKEPKLLPLEAYAPTITVGSDKPRPWRAAAQTAAINIGVWAFDRYILNAEFAHITANSIARNFKRGMVWDNDKFSTNLFAHPYHGNLYFNAARANGMNFWEAIPYTAAGSLMWEFVAEREPAALNDWIATTIGGVALGEVTNRLSLIAIDESERGGPRVAREVLAFIASPMRGINRLISGDLWRIKTQHYKYHNFRDLPVSASAGTGIRYLANGQNLFLGEYVPYININLTYGDPYRQRKQKPYDYFTFNAVLNLASNQPIISEVNLTAQLWSRTFDLHPDIDVVAGIFQHFNYFDSEPVLKNSEAIPFRISEAASAGPGILFRMAKPQAFVNIEQRAFANAILLGGSLSDYFNVIDRNYNMGSGYSLQSATDLTFRNGARLSLHLQHFHIFTSKGYTDQQLATINPLFLNTQGDKGNARLTVGHLALRIPLRRGLSIGGDTQYYMRRTNYHYRENVEHRTFETRVGLYAHF